MITAATKLTAVLGSPIAHSYSPAMHNAAFRAAGLDCEYFPIECGKDALGDILTGIRRMNFAGFNVTMPLKTEILQYLDDLDETARLAGAVNTVKVTGGKLRGHNTDGIGFIDALSEIGFSVPGKRFLFLGAGGAARGVGAAIAAGGADVLISSRRKGAAEELAAYINTFARGKASAVDAAHPKTVYDCLVNASGVGMDASAGVLPGFHFLPGALVCDMTYNPAKTKFLADAEAAGASVMNGLGMFIHQGVRAFEIWFDRASPLAVMRDAANACAGAAVH